MSSTRALVDRLVSWQLRRSVLALALALIITAICGVLAAGLTLRTRYDALLPEHSPSVVELKRLENRASAAQTVLVVLEGRDRGALRRMGDALVPALLALGPQEISDAEDGPHDLRTFLAPRLGLFLDRTELDRLERDVEARWDYEVMRATGFSLDDDEPPPLDWGAIEKRLRASVRNAAGDVVERFPDSYYERGDGTALVVIARSPVPGAISTGRAPPWGAFVRPSLACMPAPPTSRPSRCRMRAIRPRATASTGSSRTICSASAPPASRSCSRRSFSTSCGFARCW